MDKYYSLTKTLILSGIQCEKKLWFDLNDKIKLKLSKFIMKDNLSYCRTYKNECRGSDVFYDMVVLVATIL